MFGKKNDRTVIEGTVAPETPVERTTPIATDATRPLSLSDFDENAGATSTAPVDATQPLPAAERGPERVSSPDASTRSMPPVEDGAPASSSAWQPGASGASATGAAKSLFGDGARGGNAPADARDRAWRQQQTAAAGYANEAARNGYPGWDGYQAPPQTPGAGAAAQTPGGPTGPTVAQQPTPQGQPETRYRQGASWGTIMLGVVLLVVGAYGILLILVPGVFVSAQLWSVILAAILAIAGVALVLGAIGSAMGWKRGGRGGGPSADAS